MRLYPLPFRMSFFRSARSAFAQRSALALPWNPSCSYHVLSRLQPHGLRAEETQRLLSAAMVHRALAVDTVRGLVVADRIPLLTFQDLEGMPLFLMEWNRFTPRFPYHIVRSLVTSANADAAMELFLLRDPLVRLIIRVRPRLEQEHQEENDKNDGSDNNWSA
jgi:hypothetical protein